MILSTANTLMPPPTPTPTRVSPLDVFPQITRFLQSLTFHLVRREETYRLSSRMSKTTFTLDTLPLPYTSTTLPDLTCLCNHGSDGLVKIDVPSSPTVNVQVQVQVQVQVLLL